MTTRFCLIETDQIVLKKLEDIVTNLGDSITVLTGVNQAQTKIAQFRPDIIIMDIELPTVDQGLSLLSSLKNSNCTSDIVIITSILDKTVVEAAYALGISFYIAKPVNMTEISTVLQNLTVHRQYQRILHNIASAVGSIDELAKRSASITASRDQVAMQILANLGILDEPGAKDILNIVKITSDVSTLSVNEICLHLSDYYQKETLSKISWQPKAIEQRLRRAIYTSLKHIAALGLEDYNDPRFEKFAPLFFDFNEVRYQMRAMEKGQQIKVSIHLRKFLTAFFLQLEEQSI